jgi:heptosyltransferase-2
MQTSPSRILLIQTAFIGDAILATAMLEDLHQQFPEAAIDFLVRKGNEGIVQGHPYLHRVLIWNKQQGKYRHLWQLLRQIRASHYDVVINIQRYAATGLLTALSGAPLRIGFKANPLSVFFSHRIGHEFKAGLHEVERNRYLLAPVCKVEEKPSPRLYPDQAALQQAKKWQQEGTYICIAPASVWFTKQWPAAKWIDFIRTVPAGYRIYLLGSPADESLCEQIRTASERNEVYNLAGKLSLLASAALLKEATMNYVNDSAPMHLASAVQAPVCAVYCSTVPEFGYGPLSPRSFVVQNRQPLQCRPCGLHGHKRCPKKHFECAEGILTSQLCEVLES